MKKYLVLIILILSHFPTQADGIKLACSKNEPICINCPSYKPFFPISEFSQNPNSLEIEADRSEIIENTTYQLNGSVELKSDAFVLLADDVKVNSEDDTTIAKGNVFFQDNAFLISGDKLSAKKDSDGNLIATVSNALYQDYASGQGGANGSAEIIEKQPSSVFLTNATYSLCPVQENDWLIDASNIELNLEKNRGYAGSAKIKFQGLPILFVPKYSWVLKGRGSGFLTPDYDNYREPNQEERSFRIRVPYYFNLAPDRDLVAALTYMSSRGLIYEGKYRQLIAPRLSKERKDSIFETELVYLNKDKINNSKRWFFDTSVYYELTENLNINLDYNRVSDIKYFEEILRTNTNTKRLTSSLSLNLEDKPNQLKANLLTEHEQVVNLGEPEYTKALQGSLSKNFKFGQKRVNLYNDKKKELKLTDDQKTLYSNKHPVPTLTNLKVDLSSTKFKHKNPTKEAGVRNYGNFMLSKQIEAIGYPKITPNTSVSVTKYSLKKTNKDISRTIGGAGVDIDFTVSKKTKLFGLRTTHRFSPKITYNYRAKKLQGNIPIFDSKDKHDDIITFADLTSGERYTGLDRVTNANDIILSLESSFRGENANSLDKDLLNLRIAQSFYTDNEVVSDNANTNYEVRKTYSDIAAGVSVSVNKFTLSSDIQFDPYKSQIVRKENRLSFNPESRKFISLSYSDDNTKRIGKVYTAYPISSKVHAFGGLDREITKSDSTGVTKTYTSGLAYESCCWALRIAHFQEDKGEGDTGNNYSTGLELVLKGLGSTSTPLRGRIENNIPGYSANIW